MKLEKILGNLNSLEKNSFIKIIDSIISNNPRNKKAIDKILADTDRAELKNLDNVLISKIFTFCIVLAKDKSASTLILI